MTPLFDRRRVSRQESDPRADFGSEAYQRHNARRLEHLASLRLPVSGKSVLEVGAGTGDLSSFFIDRGCRLTITEPREANLRILRQRYPTEDIRPLDLEHPVSAMGRFEVVFCYGLLYHLRDPAGAITYLADACSETLFLETCVSFGDDVSVNQVAEDPRAASQAISGVGCRPTRPWVLRELQRTFPFVYVPLTQPNHQEFPIDWRTPTEHRGLSRAVFVASRRIIADDLLITELPGVQTRHP